jgi:thiosulfate/3-mercaptopyruvate sulfurtransferase
MRNHPFLIEPSELAGVLGNAPLRVFDATIHFFAKPGDLSAYDQYVGAHVPGAAFMDHERLSDLDSPFMEMVAPLATLTAELGRLGIGPDSDVVVYSSGVLPAATRAWWVLRYAGVERVRLLNGGLSAWLQAGLPVEAGARQYTPTGYSGQAQPNLFADKDEVLAAMGDPSVATVNTLPRTSYEAAHITGSTCLPAMDLMVDMSAFRPLDQIRACLTGGPAPERIITYCGGGIAATVNAMAHLMVGHRNVAVYDGSMSEWVELNLPTTRSGNGHWAIWE